MTGGSEAVQTDQELLAHQRPVPAVPQGASHEARTVDEYDKEGKRDSFVGLQDWIVDRVDS